jgi:hypothetical protein
MCRYHLYNLLADTIKQAADLLPFGGPTVTATGYVTQRLEIVVCDVTTSEDASERTDMMPFC